jgi:hypothetical protein
MIRDKSEGHKQVQEYTQVRLKTLGQAVILKKEKPPLDEWGLGPEAGATV